MRGTGLTKAMVEALPDDGGVVIVHTPEMRRYVDQMIRDRQRQRRLQRAHPLELNYAI